MPLFEVAILQNPTKKAAEEDGAGQLRSESGRSTRRAIGGDQRRPRLWWRVARARPLAHGGPGAPFCVSAPAGEAKSAVPTESLKVLAYPQFPGMVTQVLTGVGGAQSFNAAALTSTSPDLWMSTHRQ